MIEGQITEEMSY